MRVVEAVARDAGERQEPRAGEDGRREAGILSRTHVRALALLLQPVVELAVPGCGSGPEDELAEAARAGRQPA